MGPIRCPETSVKNYHATLRYTPEERSSHQHRDGSLKSRLALICLHQWHIRVSVASTNCVSIGPCFRVALAQCVVTQYHRLCSTTRPNTVYITSHAETHQGANTGVRYKFHSNFVSVAEITIFGNLRKLTSTYYSDTLMPSVYHSPTLLNCAFL
jgi:hypothetical protein